MERESQTLTENSDKERWSRIQDLFHEACAMHPAQRPSYLDRECGDDTELRRDVERLLDQDSPDTDWIAGPIGRAAGDVAGPGGGATPPLESGSRVGRYRIVEKIGEGGMGEVYLAEQDKPIRRRVALKIIKLGMDTRQVIARFDAERQALAMMDHPNIARVLDAGATEAGRPYFVMEMVDGVPITEYCDTNCLSVEQRLRLFISVCGAVQHAHQKGVIHRDLKPTNILVTPQDDGVAPKVIDFGIAKAIDQRLTEQTMFTERGQFVGTPAYMSPEQAGASDADIDTRSDIYSLGVLLYELLTGTTPFDAGSLRGAGYAEIQRIIREQEPARPSARVSTLGDTLTTVARSRGTQPSRLGTELRGDLDWIILKSLEKDRARRYETVNGFAVDVQRYLNDEAVAASPPSTAYRLKKLIRRNRGAFAAVAAIAVLLLAGVAGTSIGLARSLRAEAEARRQAEIARAVNEFLNDDLLASVAPENLGREVMVRDVLDASAEKIEGRFPDKPLVEAEIRQTIGNTYEYLGEFEPAEQHLARSVNLFAEHLGPEEPRTLEARANLGESLISQGRYDEAETIIQEVWEAQRRRLGPEDPDTLLALNNLAAIYTYTARYDEALEAYEEALAGQRAALGTEHLDTLGTMNNLANLLRMQGRLDEAVTQMEEIVEVQTRLEGKQDPNTLRFRTNLAAFYRDQGEYAKAEELHAETLKIQEVVLGEDHVHTLSSKSILASLYFRQGRVEETLAIYVDLQRDAERVLGPEHPDTMTYTSDLGVIYKALGRYADAEPMVEKALEIQRRTLGEQHPDTLRSLNTLGELYQVQDRCDQALPLYREVVTGYRAVMPEDHWLIGAGLANYGACLGQQGNYGEAAVALLDAHRITLATFGDEHERTMAAAEALARLYDAWGRPDEAREWRAHATAVNQ